MSAVLQRRIAAVLLLLAAVVALLLPFASATLLTIAVGGVAFATGIGQLLRLAGETGGPGRLLRLAAAGLYIAGAIWLLVNPIAGEISLTLFAGVLLLVNGVMELANGAARDGAAAGLEVLDGIVTASLGILIVAQWPSDSLWALGTLLAAGLAVSAVNLLVSPGRGPEAAQGS